MTVFTHDSGVQAFEDAAGAVSHDEDEGISFDWDERHVVTVDAPADLEGAFDTNEFYKIEGATIARPIKQPYVVGDELKVYKKPAEELRKAAWSFDNAPFTLGHPSTGMVKDVDDIHGFWRNARYDESEDRLREDLYVPVTDDDALEWLEDNSDVSVGFFNRVHEEYDGDTGDLTDDDVDGFQVDMFGNHVAGVEEGRCSGEDGCGLDHGGDSHGEIVTLEPLDTMDYEIAPPTADYEEDGTYYAVAPDENPDGEPKYPINSCSDVSDAWKLRGHGDLDISQSTLEDRIKRKARDLDCTVPGESEDSAEADEDCGCTNMGDDDTDPTNDNGGDGFEIPDLSVDALAEKNDAVREIVDERDELKEQVDEAESKIEEAIDAAENFSVDLEEDECYCDAVADLVDDLDRKAEEVETLEDELSEYREEERQEALDKLTDLGADEDEWEDEDLETIEEEIDRREEVAEDLNVSVKNVTDTSPEDEGGDDGTDDSYGAGRSFGRGHGA